MYGEQYLEELNEAQRAAVTYIDGPSLVIAGAGSGKTRVLVYKLLHLIDQGYDPSRLMALTFTNKAAREMRERILQKDPLAASRLQMGTFHSIFCRMLRDHAELLGYAPNFSIYNTSDSRSRIKAIVKSLQLDDKYYKPNIVHSRISAAKNRLISASAYGNSKELVKFDMRSNVPRLWEIYLRYERELRESNAMDFDDLLFQTNVLFRDHPDVLAYWQDRIDYLLIDEYQDTNLAQYMIARQLMRHKGAICVVGDDAQSIYSFRGADLRNILDFQKTFPTARLFKLEQNYRSTQTIVQAAGKLIAHNREQLPKEVFSLGDIGDPIEIHEASTADLEAMWVGKRVEELRTQKSSSYDYFAVLYRTNAQSRIVEQVFRRMNIPFRIYGGHSFFDHKEIMDVMAYLRVVVNITDEEAMLRIINYPRRGIGDTTILKVREYASLEGIGFYAGLCRCADGTGVALSRATQAKLKGFLLLLEDMRRQVDQSNNFFELMNSLISATGIPGELALDMTEEGISRQQNVKELISSIVEYAEMTSKEGREPTVSGYLGEIALMTDQDKDDDLDGPKVTVMTAHASKGLEFPHVFIIGMEEKLFPSIRFGDDDDNIEEERRLFYVAMTRAERTCHIGYARERFYNGRTEFGRPSRFLGEIPDSLVRRNRAAENTNAYTAKRGYHGFSGDSLELPRSFSPVSFLPSQSSSGSRRVYVGRKAKDEEVVQHERIGDLTIGARVMHQRFGQGEILSLEGEGGNVMAVVCFDGGDTKKLLLRFAKLVVL